MLEDVLRYINNRFDRDPWGCWYGIKSGTFEVVDGTIDIDGLLGGQYFWVEGSVLNDGLHLYPDTDMRDERFTGRIVLLAVPDAVVEIASEIEDWCDANAKALSGPYQSESFGGYSYTLAGSSSGNETPSEAWQAKFGGRLRQFRKLGRDWI